MNFSINPTSFRNASRLYYAVGTNSWNTNRGGRYFPAVVLYCLYSDAQRFRIRCRYLNSNICVKIHFCREENNQKLLLHNILSNLYKNDTHT